MAAATRSRRGFWPSCPERIRDTPLSELGFTGAGIGAAMAGMRPIVELMTVNFSLLALDQILTTRPRRTCRETSSARSVIPMATGAGRQLLHPNIRIASKPGTRIFPGSRCWLPRRSKTLAECYGPRCRPRTRS